MSLSYFFLYPWVWVCQLHGFLTRNPCAKLRLSPGRFLLVWISTPPVLPNSAKLIFSKLQYNLAITPWLSISAQAKAHWWIPVTESSIGFALCKVVWHPLSPTFVFHGNPATTGIFPAERGMWHPVLNLGFNHKRIESRKSYPKSLMSSLFVIMMITSIPLRSLWCSVSCTCNVASLHPMQQLCTLRQCNQRK